MRFSIEYLILTAAVLLLVSVFTSKASGKFGIPALLLFLAVGMAAGWEGLGGIHFHDPLAAKSLGIVALIFIIFSGGLDTRWGDVKPIVLRGASLATLGVLATAVLIGGFAAWVLHWTWLEGLLLGAIVSCTDAAAVFSVLRSRRIGLKGNLRPVLEFESGSNDPMAVFLTVGIISIINSPDKNLFRLVPYFLWDMGVGAAMGLLMPRVMLWIINRIKLEYEGLYPVLTTALVGLTYAATAAVHGNGFLAVYLAALVLGNSRFLHKRTLKRFHEGLAWLMQIAMFLTLGLMLDPAHLLPYMGVGLLLSLFLIFVARPVSVWLALPTRFFTFREKSLIAWLGLRGAAPIVLATFPMLAGVPRSEIMFQLVFFIVVTSVLIQGTTFPWVARRLKVDAPLNAKGAFPIELDEVEGIDADIVDVLVPYSAEVVGKRIFEIGIPKDCLVVLISKGEGFVIPNGTTVLEGGEVLLVLANKKDLAALQAIIGRHKKSEPKTEEA
ncbi:MAG: potassium/proton antiporter [Candidatus Firestonebacteria bacterium]|nr:potassium/proton antiporter [Candidatus Firestonebacteria bacterium]